MAKICLTDLVAASTATAQTSRGEIDVHPLTIDQIASVLRRYPELLASMSGGTIKLSALTEQAPGAVAAIIAAGCGMRGAVGENMARKLAPGDTLAIMSAVFEVTFPGGIADFFEKLAAMMGTAAAQAPQKPNGAGKPVRSAKPKVLAPKLNPRDPALAALQGL